MGTPNTNTPSLRQSYTALPDLRLPHKFHCSLLLSLPNPSARPVPHVRTLLPNKLARPSPWLRDRFFARRTLLLSRSAASARTERGGGMRKKSSLEHSRIHAFLPPPPQKYRLLLIKYMVWEKDEYSVVCSRLSN